ncbi:MAG: ECF-type sigma factor [Pirellulaceae bacterium]|nr:sigma-70 family RNA polymerase sigma factor [Planctomycetales bacterium]
MTVDPSKLTDLIRRAAADDPQAKEQLYARVYDDLRSVARSVMWKNKGGELQTTALVNEVILRFERGNSLKTIDNRRVFFSVALQAMHQILVDHYRRRRKSIDSPDRKPEPLDEAVRTIESQVGADFEQLQQALDKLQRESPRQHAVIMHRFFGGLTISDTAILLEVSEQTVERDWRLARAKLFRNLKDD